MDDYKKLGKEWGSKARKAESRQHKKRLREQVKKEPTEEEVHPAEIGIPHPREYCVHSLMEHCGILFCVHCGAGVP